MQQLSTQPAWLWYLNCRPRYFWTFCKNSGNYHDRF